MFFFFLIVLPNQLGHSSRSKQDLRGKIFCFFHDIEKCGFAIGSRFHQVSALREHFFCHHCAYAPATHPWVRARERETTRVFQLRPSYERRPTEDKTSMLDSRSVPIHMEGSREPEAESTAHKHCQCHHVWTSFDQQYQALSSTTWRLWQQRHWIVALFSRSNPLILVHVPCKIYVAQSRCENEERERRKKETKRMVISANGNIREKTQWNIPTKPIKRHIRIFIIHERANGNDNDNQTSTLIIIIFTVQILHNTADGSFIRLYAGSLAAAVARSLCVEQRQQKWVSVLSEPNRAHTKHTVSGKPNLLLLLLLHLGFFWCVVFFIEANLCFCASAVCPNLWFCCLLPVLVCSSNIFL